MDSIAFEMGAVFLLAGMLMFGTAHGFIPRSLRNIGAPILVVGALIGFLVWRFGADMSAHARETIRSISGSGSTSSSDTPVASSGEPPVRGKAATPNPVISKQKYPSSNGIVIRDAGPTEIQRIPPADSPVAEQSAHAPQAKQVPDSTDSSGSSPYDSGVKRAFVNVEHALHIGGKKQTSPQ
jgi:hypothetical protein